MNTQLKQCLWRMLAVIAIVLAMMPTVVQSVSAQDEYEEMTFVLPVDQNGVAVLSDSVKAAGVNANFVTIKARMYRRGMRLRVSAFSPQPVDQIAFKIKKNDFEISSATKNVGPNEVEIFDQENAFSFGDIFDIRAQKNQLVSEVFLETLDSAPVHVWLVLDGVRCLVIEGHNDPEILVRIFQAGTDQLLKEEHFTRTTEDWEVALSAGPASQHIDVQVVVSSKWENNAPAGVIRGHYKFLNVENPCFISKPECAGIVTQPAAGTNIEPNTAVTVSVQTTGAQSVQIFELDNNWSPVSSIVPVTDGNTTVNFQGQPNHQYAVGTTNERGTFMGCSFKFGEVVPEPQCLGVESVPAPGSKLVGGDLVKGTVDVANVNSAQLVLLNKTGGIESRIGTPLAVTANKVNFEFQPLPNRQYAFELSNARGTKLGCPINWDQHIVAACNSATFNVDVPAGALTGSAQGTGTSWRLMQMASPVAVLVQGPGSTAVFTSSVQFPAKYWVEFLDEDGVPSQFNPACSIQTSRLYLPLVSNQKPAICNAIDSTVPSGYATLQQVAQVTVQTQNAAAVALDGQIVTPTNGVSVFNVPVTVGLHIANLQTLNGIWEPAPQCSIEWKEMVCEQITSSVANNSHIYPAGLRTEVAVKALGAKKVRFGGSEADVVDGWANFQMMVTPGHEYTTELSGTSGEWVAAPQCSLQFETEAPTRRGFGEGDPYWANDTRLEGDLDSTDGTVAPQKTDRHPDYQDYRVASWSQSYQDGHGKWAFAKSVTCVKDGTEVWKTVTDFYSPNGEGWQSHSRFAGQNFRVRNLAGRLSSANIAVDLYNEGGPSYEWGSQELKDGLWVDGWLIKSITFRMDGHDAQAIALIRQGVEIWLVRQPDGYGRVDVVEKSGNTCQLQGVHGLGVTTGSVPNANDWVVADLFGTQLAAAASTQNVPQEVVTTVPDNADWTDDFPAVK